MHRVCSRWVAAFEALAEDVVVELNKRPELPQGFIFNNKYFIGGGSDKRCLDQKKGTGATPLIIITDKVFRFSEHV